MEENKFEKQVQEKMNELKIQPSDSVWGKIEERLDQRNRRKWGFLLIFLLLFMVAGGGFWLWNAGRQGISKDDVTLDTREGNPSKEYKIQKNSTVKKTNVADDTTNYVGNTTGEKSSNNKNVYNEPLEQNGTVLPANTPIKRKAHTNEIIASSNRREIDNLTNDETRPEAPPEEDTAERSFENKQVKPVHLNNATAVNIKIPVDLINYSLTEMNNILKGPISKDAIPTISARQLQNNTIDPGVKFLKNKWHPGIVIAGGVSLVGTNFFGTGSGSLADYSTSPGSSNSSGGAIYHLSNATTGFGFLIGFVEEKNVTGKTKISFGLNFTFSRLTYRVGTFNATSRFYDARNAVNNYSAHYNFLAFPANIKIRVGGTKSVFYWQIGTTISQLLGTNALQFNSSSGYYYQDNSVFNKTQIGINTAVDVLLFSKRNVPVSIGPYFYYGLSKIAKQGLYDNKHFSFVGIRTDIQLGK